MPKISTPITLFARLGHLRQSIEAIPGELTTLEPQVPPVDDGHGFDLGADLRSQLQNAAASIEEAAEMLEAMSDVMGSRRLYALQWRCCRGTRRSTTLNSRFRHT